MSVEENIIQFWQRKYEKKFTELLKIQVSQKNEKILGILLKIINEEKDNGIILSNAVKGYFRIKRKDTSDCNPLFELYNINDVTLSESLLEVLGYDRMVPNSKDQQTIIQIFYDFGKGIDVRYFTDPRYGLAAACAGWDFNIVEPFLKHCLTTSDAPLKYVAENSLKRKYVRLR
jgi:hypothetical protein